ncbi:MAG: hypothetical protein ACC651_17670 [Candidatus Scalindua sp.]
MDRKEGVKYYVCIWFCNKWLDDKKKTMNDQLQQLSTKITGEDEGEDIFKVWKEYEGVAMHFNELIIQLRVRALGGVAAISALVGVFSKGDTPEDFRWGILVSVLVLLCFVWIAIWLLDIRYYNRLLIGAVRAILEVETLSKQHVKIKKLNMSHRIEGAVSGDFSGLGKEPFWSGRRWFYILVFIALLLGVCFSLGQYYISKGRHVPQPVYETSQMPQCQDQFFQG